MTMEQMIPEIATRFGISQILVGIVFAAGGGLIGLVMFVRVFTAIRGSETSANDTVQTVKTVYDETGKFISKSKRGYRKYEPKL